METIGVSSRHRAARSLRLAMAWAALGPLIAAQTSALPTDALQPGVVQAVGAQPGVPMEDVQVVAAPGLVGELLAGLALPAPGPDSAPASSWAATQDATQPSWKWKKRALPRGEGPAIAVDADGRPHVFFYRRDPLGSYNDYFVTHSWLEGSKWLSEDLETWSPSPGHVSAAIDADGVFHVAYTAGGGNDTSLRYARGDGASWQLETIESGGMEPAIAIDEAGRVHIVHLRLHDFTVPPVNEIRYVEQTPSGWQSEAFDGLTFGAPSLSVREGTIHATYGRFLTSGEVPANILRLAVREGGRWTIQDLDQGDASALVVDAEGGLHVVYRDHLVEELRYAWNTGVGWQSMVLATGTSLFGEPLKNDKISMSFFAPAMALDPEGRLQLCFGIGISNGESGTHFPLAATLEDGVWWPRVLGPSKFTLNTLAISSSGIVHAIGTRPTQGTTAVTTLSQKGRKLTLSVVPKEAGVITDTVTGAECTGKLVQSYAAGAEVTLTVTPAPGYAFIGWTGAASGTEPSCTVTLEKSRKVVARFEALPP